MPDPTAPARPRHLVAPAEAAPDRRIGFRCPRCEHRVFRDDLTCVNCELDLVFDPDTHRFVEDAPTCANRGRHACNWVGRPDRCAACRRLSLSLDAGLDVPFAAALRRTLDQLARYDVVVDRLSPSLHVQLLVPYAGHTVTIGHSEGLVTLDVSEADPVQLEETRTELGEPYRTPLGHVRHELGHWFWDAVVQPDDRQLDAFRARFGDERDDYQAALAAHYDKGDDGTWRDRYLSYYASAHPWEDFAECFAHVLHLRDLLDTAGFGGRDDATDAIADGFDGWYPRATELAVQLNDLTRAMGVDDPYPFAPPEPAVDKLRWVDGLLDEVAAAQRDEAQRR